MNTSKHAASLAVLCATVLGAAAAFADETPQSVTLSIPHNMDAVHAAHLYKQIQGAARQVCERLDSRDLALKHQYNLCVANAVANAVTQVRSKQLTAIHLAAMSAGHTPAL